MTQDALQVILPLLAAVAMGSVIGLERTMQGHAAGFRTHALVCLTSCALMLLASQPSAWMGAGSPDVLRTTVARVIQGVMTGIGFLGAGVIMKQGLEVRGLTTAAAIWSAAAVGILLGLGSFWTATATTALTLVMLNAFRRVESRLPTDLVVHASVCVARDEIMTEEDLRTLVEGFNFHIVELAYALDANQLFAYRLVMKTRSRTAMNRLAVALRSQPAVRQFEVALLRD